MITIEWNPRRRTLRLFGRYTGAFVALLGAWVLWRHALLGMQFSAETTEALSAVLLSAGALMLLLGVVRPQWLRWVYIAMNVAAFPIGWVVSHLILFVVFYLFFVPLGLIFKLIGRDALHRKPDVDAKTYWVNHSPPRSAKGYFNQY